MADDSFAPPATDGPFASAAGSAPMPPLELAAAVVYFVSGGLLLLWGMWSMLGTLIGGLMSAGAVVTMDEEMLIGIPILLIYGVWLVVCFVAGPLQLFAGVQLVRRRAGDKLLWVAAFSGLAGAITVYCAMPSMVAFGLGLAVAITRKQD